MQIHVQYGRFLPRDALLGALYVPSSCVCPCVCVCMSVTLRYCIKTAKRNVNVMQIMPHDRSATLVYTDKRVARSLCHSRATCDTIPECDRHTHTQTDRQTHDDGIYRGSIASRGKKKQCIQDNGKYRILIGDPHAGSSGQRRLTAIESGRNGNVAGAVSEAFASWLHRQYPRRTAVG